MTPGGKYAYGVASYDAAGNLRWGNFWQDAAGDPAVATGIAVDYSGDVYVAGVNNTIGGHTPNSRFAVVKFRHSDGHVVWTSQNSYGSYHFDNGAIILDSTGHNDGLLGGLNSTDPELDTEKWRCSISIEDTADLQPTFAIAGPSPDSAGTWCTAAFDYSPTDGVELKANWPQHVFGTGQATAVATTSSDHAVYVTGSAPDFSGGSPYALYTTVRYSGAGHLDWQDQWQDHGKGGEGEALVADKFNSGRVYVTGYLQSSGGTSPEPTVYGTCEISTLTDGSGNITANDDWEQGADHANGVTFGEGGTFNRGTSIDVSYERGSDANSGMMIPYVYVTGLSQLPLATTWDIATLRYTTGVSPTGGAMQWTPEDRFAAQIGHGLTGLDGPCSHPYYWPSVLGAGKGNAYIIGSQYNGTKYNYAFLGRTKTDGSRFTTSYTANSTDLGHALATGGAGLMYFTGQSTISGSDIDLATGQNLEMGIASAHASAMTPWAGIVMNPPPPVSLVQAEDGVFLSVQVTPFNPAFAAEYAFDVLVPTTATELSIRIKGYVDVPGSYEEVLIHNSRTGHWDEVSYMPAPLTNTESIIPLKDDPAEYIDPLTGKVQIAVGYTNGAGLNWYAHYDYVGCETVN